VPYSLNLQAAVDTLRSGGVVAYPTEAVWGLGCDPLNEAAVERVLRLKQRDSSKGLILIAACIQQFEPYLDELTAQQRQELERHWPGPYTYIVPANNRVTRLIKGEHSGVALRVSAHKPAVDLCKAFGGPIVSSSANLAGLPAAKWPWQVHKQLANQLDYLLPGQLGGGNKPSQIRDLISGKILRNG
jgi:L-threonylcarbamoyladenylate synthase